MGEDLVSRGQPLARLLTATEEEEGSRRPSQGQRPREGTTELRDRLVAVMGGDTPGKAETGSSLGARR